MLNGANQNQGVKEIEKENATKKEIEIMIGIKENVLIAINMDIMQEIALSQIQEEDMLIKGNLMECTIDIKEVVVEAQDPETTIIILLIKEGGEMN